MRCVQCANRDFRRILAPARRTVGGVLFTGETPAEKCTNCGAVTMLAKDAQRFDDQVVREVAARGPVSGDGLRLLREHAELQSQELAVLLGVTPHTVSRWENNKGPIDLATWASVGALALDRLDGRTTMLERLRAATKKPRKRVRLAA